ncbi:amidase family protein [Solimonas flava]|uniref:amidase family protein n=1 Tax=Solimonas flava TaxID=415849 RepID=UPI0004179A08|nr:amidase family protein [Solimonas flava]
MKPLRLHVPLLAIALACAAGAAPAATLDLDTATIADVQAAYKAGLSAEALTQAYLARIAAYDKKGPAINAVITLNPKALAEAKALDAERRAGKLRGPLHGVPIVLKDNFDTYDLPTTAGSQLLHGSLPPDDAFVVKKLRAAGAVIVAKVNLSEFAGSGGSVSGAKDPAVIKAGRVPNGFSSEGGQTHNPHDLTRGPSGSSGGTGAAIAAAFAQFGLGTDTGGSVRGPSSANGIAGLKPTRGLMSRDGIVPLALSYDTGGPMARSVYDVAVALGAMTGVDAADAATAPSAAHFKTDYTPYLKKGSLKGARIGIARDFMGRDAGTDAVMEKAIATLKSLGAVVVDPIQYPEYMLVSKQPNYNLLVASEFKAQLTEYLHTLKPGFPRSFDEIVAKANDPATRYRSPEKAYALKYTAAQALDLSDPQYLALKNEEMVAIKAGIDALFSKHKLDAIVYPTSPTPATPIVPDPDKPADPRAASGSATSFANQTGYPDLIVPAGMSAGGLPVTISFFGPAWSEPKLLGYGYDFEQATHAIRLPKNTPALAGDRIHY